MAIHKPLVVANGAVQQLPAGDSVEGASAALDGIFYPSAQTLTSNRTLVAGQNYMAAGPLAIGDSVVLEVEDGVTLTIV
jgi:hypothetical protein